MVGFMKNRTLLGIVAASFLSTPVYAQSSHENLYKNTRFSSEAEEVACLEAAHITPKKANRYPVWLNGCEIRFLDDSGIGPRRAKLYNVMFTGYDIGYLMSHDISPEEADALLLQWKGTRTAPAAYALALAQIKNHDGMQRFLNHEIESLYNANISISYIDALAPLVDKKNETLFRHAKTIIEYKNLHGTGEYAQELLSITTKEELPLFNAEELLMYKSLDGTIAYAKDLASIVDSTGNPLFDGFKIYRSFQLGLTKTDFTSFQDTEKPNAVLVYPTEDKNGAFQNNVAIDLFRKMKGVYDTWVVFATTEHDVYTALTSIPNIEFLVLAGHGSPHELILGTMDIKKAKEEADEVYTIDRTDFELGQYLENLHPDATIFLNACKTAEGARNDTDNLANFIIGLAGERSVIAATDSFTMLDIQIQSLYPFEIKIIKDVTYQQ